MIDDPDGSYRWTTTIAAAAHRRGRAASSPTTSLRRPDADGNFGGIVTTPGGEVALATVRRRRADARCRIDRRRRRVAARRQRLVGAGGRCSTAPVARPSNAVVAAGSTVVGVGEQSSVDPATGAEQLVPLVLVGDGSAFEPVTVEGAGAASLTAACQAPDGIVLAFGRDTATGANVVVVVDLVARRRRRCAPGRRDRHRSAAPARPTRWSSPPHTP